MPEIRWQKSSYSTEAEANCVELARLADSVLVRESEAPDAVISTSTASLRALLRAVKADARGDDEV